VTLGHFYREERGEESRDGTTATVCRIQTNENERARRESESERERKTTGVSQNSTLAEQRDASDPAAWKRPVWMTTRDYPAEGRGVAGVERG
jgi:hypothetical protein